MKISGIIGAALLTLSISSAALAQSGTTNSGNMNSSTGNGSSAGTVQNGGGTVGRSSTDERAILNTSDNSNPKYGVTPGTNGPASGDDATKKGKGRHRKHKK